MHLYESPTLRLWYSVAHCTPKVSLDIAENSRCESTINGYEALPNHGVVTSIKYVAAARLDQQTGAIDESVRQCLNGLKRPDRSSLAIRRAPLRGASLHGPHQVEGEDTEQVPGAVAVKTLRRQAIEREAAFEFTVNPLIGAAPAHEEPQAPPVTSLLVTMAEYSK